MCIYNFILSVVVFGFGLFRIPVTLGQLVFCHGHQINDEIRDVRLSIFKSMDQFIGAITAFSFSLNLL